MSDPTAEDFDISTYAAQDTAEIELQRPDGEPMTNAHGQALSVTVYGPGSRTYQHAQSVRNRAILAFVRRGSHKKMADDEQRLLDAEFLAACTVSFNGFGYKGMPKGPEMYKAAYLDPKMGLVSEQVNKGIGDWANFLPKLAKN